MHPCSSTPAVVKGVILVEYKGAVDTASLEKGVAVPTFLPFPELDVRLPGAVVLATAGKSAVCRESIPGVPVPALLPVVEPGVTGTLNVVLVPKELPDVLVSPETGVVVTDLIAETFGESGVLDTPETGRVVMAVCCEPMGVPVPDLCPVVVVHEYVLWKLWGVEAERMVVYVEPGVVNGIVVAGRVVSGAQTFLPLASVVTS